MKSRAVILCLSLVSFFYFWGRLSNLLSFSRIAWISHPRAVWAWEFDQAVDLDVGFYKKLGIDTVYLQLPETIDSRRLGKLMGFLKNTSRQGIAVYALDGEPHWALSEYRNEALSFVRKVLALNSKMPIKFAGIHLDIEPYLLPQWKQNHEEVIQNYLATLEMIQKETVNSNIRLEVAIPFWFDQGEEPFMFTYKGKTAYISSHILDIVDSVAVMAYRKDIGEIVNFCREELSYGQTVRKNVRVGIEVKDFRSEEYTEFLKKVRSIEKALQKFPAFCGISFHDLEGLRQLFGQ